jgi:hypothetical protein
MESSSSHEDIRRVWSNKATERTDIRRELRTQFGSMTVDEKRTALTLAKSEIDNYDQFELSCETAEEDPLLRGHRLRMETTVELLSADITLQ